MAPLSPSMMTMDKKGGPTRRRNRAGEVSREEIYDTSSHDISGGGGIAIELQSSSPNERKQEGPKTSSTPTVLATAATAAQDLQAAMDTQAVAAAARKEEESLYDQLLRHHKENNLDDSNSYSNSVSDTFDAYSVMSVMSEEDRKLPALPLSSALQGKPKRLVSRPYSRNHVDAVVSGSGQGVQGDQPAIAGQSGSYGPSREHGRGRSRGHDLNNTGKQGTGVGTSGGSSIGSSTGTGISSTDDTYPRADLVTRSLSGRSLHGTGISSRRDSAGTLSQPNTSNAPTVNVGTHSRTHTHTMNRSQPEKFTDNICGGDRKKVFKQSREQSSFYKAALLAAGESDPPPIAPPNDLEQDERLARELSQRLEEPPPPSVLDEELARVLQAAEPKPPEASEQDVVLALQLMEQEEQRGKPASTGVETTASTLASFDDEELAIRLSKGIPLGPNADELLARQLSQFEKPAPLQAPAEMVPEQLQILERIQQDKERLQIEQAMMESSLHELPVFQETSELGFGPSSTGDRSNEQDYQLSQELALNEWTSLQDRGTENRPIGDGVDSRSIGHSGSGSLRSTVSWSVADSRNNQATRMQVPNNLRQQQPNNSRLQHSLNSRLQQPQNPRLQQPHNPRGQQHDEDSFVNRVPGRAVSVDPGGRELPIEPRLGPARVRSTVPGAREERRQPQSHSQSQSDLARPRPPDELLRRGNQETRSAIATGRAHVVLCQGCDNRLHAPMNYSLVFCPTCNTISPGLTATNSTNGGFNNRGGSSI